ncbi:MAG: hypothetical protein AAGA23_15635 [Pseudomonadota bacterium]
MTKRLITAAASVGIFVFTSATAGSVSDLLYSDSFEDPGPPRIDVAGSLTSKTISLPGNGANAAELPLVVHYLGTGKSIDGAARRQVPFRSYFASCDLASARPRMFVSITQEDVGPQADPEHPRVGSLLELRYNPANRQLEPTGNQAVVGFCNETHGIAASADCSRVAVLCSTAIAEPISETYNGTFRDLVDEAGSIGREVVQVSNEAIIDAIPGLTPQERADRYQYNGEMWLLEYANGNFSAEPQRFVIHKGYGGGSPFGAPSLVYSDSDNAYAAAFATNVFDRNYGGRHHSAALMIIERDGWKLNDDDRGWSWACGYGHVFNLRAFWNPYVTTERGGEFGMLCSTDGNNHEAQQAGSIAVKYESSNLFEGATQYLFASNSSGVSNGGGHTLIPLDADRSIGLMVGAEMEPMSDPNYVAHIEEAEAAAVRFYGAEEASARGLTGLAACNWYDDDNCLFNYTNYVHDGAYPLFQWGFWWKDQGAFNSRDLSRVGIFHTSSASRVARNIPQADGSMVKWLAQDNDCMFGAPQLVDLKNGRLLLGYGRFQCISDGFHLRRFATGANRTRSVSTLIPSQYFLMEIDADGNALTQPTAVPGVGWGGLDAMVELGEGRAAWAFIRQPELRSDGSFPEPNQSAWDAFVYESGVSANSSEP